MADVVAETSIFHAVQAFLKLEGLERLYLQHNNLTSIPSNLPRTLRDLRINHNKIEQVIVLHIFISPQILPVICLTRIHQRHVLKMIYAVDQVSPADLEGMVNLTILYIHDNTVKDMGTSLAALKSLTLLDISSNKLTKVSVKISLQMSHERNG